MCNCVCNWLEVGSSISLLDLEGLRSYISLIFFECLDQKMKDGDTKINHNKWLIDDSPIVLVVRQKGIVERCYVSVQLFINDGDHEFKIMYGLRLRKNSYEGAMILIKDQVIYGGD